MAPRHHGRGVGAAIVEEVERRARLISGLAPAGERVVPRIGTLSDEPRVSALLSARGYVEVPRFRVMRIAFDAPPAPPEPPPGVELRALREREELLVYECLREAFEDRASTLGWG
ncbi:MAG TPA: hypothetical protein VMU66_03670 [Gaiellales bacterium]|nr:hypothetical protein [Gaiellales bacterium]